MKILIIIVTTVLTVLLVVFISQSTPSPSGEGALEVQTKMKPTEISELTAPKMVTVPSAKDIKETPKLTRGSHQAPAPDYSVDNLPEFNGTAKKSFVFKPGECNVLSNFDVVSNRFSENAQDIALKLGEQQIFVYIFVCKDNQQPKDHVIGLKKFTSSGSIGFRGDKKGLEIGDYNFVHNLDATDRIVFVRDNIYCRIDGAEILPGIIKNLAESIDAQIKE